MKLTKNDLLKFAKTELDTEGVSDAKIKQFINSIMNDLCQTACDYLEEDLKEVKREGITLEEYKNENY